MERLTTRKEPNLSAPKWVYPISPGVSGRVEVEVGFATEHSSGCNEFDLPSDLLDECLGSKPTTEGLLIDCLDEELLVATPGRVSRDRRRVIENRWLSTMKYVLEDVASSRAFSWMGPLVPWEHDWSEYDLLGCLGLTNDWE